MAIDNNNNSDDIQKKSVEEIAREQEKSRPQSLACLENP